jgi:hypothetical protein
MGVVDDRPSKKIRKKKTTTVKKIVSRVGTRYKKTRYMPIRRTIYFRENISKAADAMSSKENVSVSSICNDAMKKFIPEKYFEIARRLCE